MTSRACVPVEATTIRSLVRNERLQPRRAIRTPVPSATAVVTMASAAMATATWSRPRPISTPRSGSPSWMSVML